MKKVIFKIFILILVTGVVGPIYAGDVAVIKSSGAAVYKESLEGFRQTIRHRVVAEYDMRDDYERGRKALEKLQSTVNPNLLFTVGTPALQVASQKKSSLPAVYSMVFNPDSIIGTEMKNITGVSMNVSVKETIQLLKELSPNIRRVGVVFNPAKSGNLVIKDMPVARKQGIQLVTRQIGAANKAIQAVNSLRGKIDAFWIVPDETILADEIFQYMLLFSYQNKIPVLGLSEKQTEMGALLSLSSRSNKDMGRQAGEMANKILREGKLPRTPYTTPRQVKLSVNLKVARKLNVEVPDSLLAKVANAIQAPVYEEGDWWVFRVKAEGAHEGDIGMDGGESHEIRVTYKNGRFESDYPGFLTQADNPDSPRFYPFASVNVNDHKIRSLNFPLVPGKKWNFNYHRDVGKAESSVWGRAESEVIDPVVEDFETQVGKLKFIEIRRIDYSSHGLGNPSTQELVYFYSPETKSVVKLTANVLRPGRSGKHFELELVKYGHQVPSNFSKAINDLSIPDHKEMNIIKLGEQASNVKAPVYVDGDWWVFRVKNDEKPPEEYRITYKDGEFQGDDPLILTDNPPLASVYTNHPEIKNFNFPLVPGKKWRLRYSSHEYAFYPPFGARSIE